MTEKEQNVTAASEGASGEKPTGEAPEGKTVPYERFSAVVRERNALQGQIEEAQREREAVERERLASQGEYQRLYEQAQTEKQQAEERLLAIEKEREQERRQNAIMTAGAQHKPPVLSSALDDLLKIADLGALDNNDLAGSAAAQVEELLKTRQHWLAAQRQGAGSPVGPSPSGNGVGTEAQRKAFAQTIRNMR